MRRNIKTTVRCSAEASSELPSVLSEEHRQQLRLLLEDADLLLLYKASAHGYDAAAFHQRCDNQGPTVVVVYNTAGATFGGYTSVDYAQTGQEVKDEHMFLFSFQGKTTTCIRPESEDATRSDHEGMPIFGQQVYFCYSGQPSVYQAAGSSFSIDAAFPYGTSYSHSALSECEVYSVRRAPVVSVEKPWRNVTWTAARREQLLEFIRAYKPPAPLSRLQMLMIGPVGAGKSSFFNSILMGRVTCKAMSGPSGASVTTQFRTYGVRDSGTGKMLPLVLCDTMGLEEQERAGLDPEDICSILQGLVPDRYTFNPVAPLQKNSSSAAPPTVHCVCYVIDATKLSLMSSKLEQKLTAVRRKLNSLGLAQVVLLTKVDEACPQVEKNLENVYSSPYIKSKVLEVSSRLGVPVSCVFPIKNYSHELDLDLRCDVLLLMALQKIISFADDYLDDVCPLLQPCSSGALQP